jgi:hypothetical protein
VDQRIGLRDPADLVARIETMTAMVTVQDETVQLRRLIEFASDVAELANERPDLDLRNLVDDLHHDLIRFTTDEED